MSHSPKKNQGSHDRTRISLGERWEREYWPNRLGVAAADVEEAVQAVGPSVSAVEHYLAQRKTRPSSPQDPVAPEPFRGYVFDEDETVDARRRQA